MDKVNLTANKRIEISKASRSALRKNGRVPGIYYSKSSEPIAIDVVENMINPLVFTSKTNLINLQLNDGSEHECIIKDVQFDPVTDKVVHFDLLGLTKGEKIQIEIPVQFLGNAIGIKEGGIMQVNLHRLEVECLPKDLPPHIEIDVTNLHIGETVHVSSLALENITILNPSDAAIVAIVHPKVEKEVVEEAEAQPTEPEVIAKGKAEKEEEE